MSIYKSAVTKPITTVMIFTAVMVLGIYSLINIPIDLYPEIEPPFISIMTTYAGANAADIETNITKPIEDAMNSVDQLKEVTSVSYDNLSLVTLEFEWGANLDGSVVTMRSAVGLSEDNQVLYYFAGPSLSMPVLADAMQRTGVDDGMLLDINPTHAHFTAFRVQDGELIAEPLFPEEMDIWVDRYLHPWKQDFFYLTEK